jgi:hypothetical protein
MWETGNLFCLSDDIKSDWWPAFRPLVVLGNILCDFLCFSFLGIIGRTESNVYKMLYAEGRYRGYITRGKNVLEGRWRRAFFASWLVGWEGVGGRLFLLLLLD